MTLGDRVRRARKAKSLTQLALVAAVKKAGGDLSQPQLSAIEKDEVDRPGSLLELASALGTTPAALLGKPERTQKAQIADQPDYRHFAAEVRRRAKVLKLSVDDLSRKAGVHIDVVENIFRDREFDLTTDGASRLARALGCTVDDLTGQQSQTPIREGNSVVLFEVHTSSQSGPGGGGDLEISRDRSVGEYSFPAAGFRQRFGAVPEGVFIDEVGGDSNLPTLVPGQLLMIDSRVKTPYPPGFFLCWDGNGMVLKRLSVVPKSKPPRVQLISDNKNYPTYEVRLDEIEIYGRVIGTWMKL